MNIYPEAPDGDQKNMGPHEASGDVFMEISKPPGRFGRRGVLSRAFCPELLGPLKTAPGLLLPQISLGSQRVVVEAHCARFFCKGNRLRICFNAQGKK